MMLTRNQRRQRIKISCVVNEYSTGKKEVQRHHCKECPLNVFNQQEIPTHFFISEVLSIVKPTVNSSLPQNNTTAGSFIGDNKTTTSKEMLHDH